MARFKVRMDMKRHFFTSASKFFPYLAAKIIAPN